MPSPRVASKKPATPAPFGSPDGTATTEDEVIEFDLDGGNKVQPGQYEAQVADVRQMTSKAGNPMLVWDFVVLSGDYAGMNVPQFTVLNTDSLWKVTETVVALGLADVATDKRAKFNKSQAIGRTCVVSVTQDNSGYDPSVKTVHKHPKGATFRKDALKPQTKEEVEAEIAADDDMPF